MNIHKLFLFYIINILIPPNNKIYDGFVTLRV